MRKTLLLAAALAAIAVGASADEGSKYFYDARGNRIGSATTYNNTTVWYDSDGDRTGSAVVSPSGVTTFFDKFGKPEVTVTGPLELGATGWLKNR
jgi:hypothetical protein